MKKLFLTILLAITFNSAFAQELVLSPVEIENRILAEQLAESNELKDHYKKMAIYSEQEMLIAQARAEASEVSFNQANSLLNNSYRAVETANRNTQVTAQVNEALIIMNEDALDMIKHHESLQAGYEAQLYEYVVTIQRMEEEKLTIETRMNEYLRSAITLIIGMFVCFILYTLQKVVLSRKPKTKVTKTKTTKTKPNLEVVKKDTKTKTKKESTKKEETPKSEVPKVSKWEHFWSQRAKEKALKKNQRLERLRKKELSPKAGDVDDDHNEIQSNNKKLLGGILAPFIGAIMKTSPPTEEPKTGEVKDEKVKAEPKTKTKKGNVPKKNVPKKSAPSKKATTKTKPKTKKNKK